jgi:hypothetical protein
VTRDELLDQAAALDVEAGEYREGGPKAEELLRRAAGLRVQALGPRPYPVLVCGACGRLTGWLSVDGLCAADVQRRREHAGGGFLSIADRSPHPATEPGGLLRRIERALGVSRRRDRMRAWLAQVEPGETGPIAPEEGWELEAPVKVERPAPEGAHLLVCFDVESLRFDSGAWREVASTRGGKPRRLVPREFPASVPVEQLVEAWSDFKDEVAAHNRSIWEAESERREARRRAEAERRAAEDEERGTSELLR